MTGLIEFLKSKAIEQGDSSREWKSAGNGEQVAYRAGVANNCLEILDFISRHPESMKEMPENFKSSPVG